LLRFRADYKTGSGGRDLSRPYAIIVIETETGTASFFSLRSDAHFTDRITRYSDVFATFKTKPPPSLKDEGGRMKDESPMQVFHPSSFILPPSKAGGWGVR
jgi:hypothetical protein